MFTPNEDKILTSGHVWHGVAIGWKKELSASILPLKSTYERVAGIKLSSCSKSLLLVSFYAPTAGHDEDFLESISYLSDFLASNMSIGDQILIGADCNCSSKSTIRRQHSWKNFCETFELEMNLTTYPIFHHHNGTSNSFIVGYDGRGF